MLNVLHIDAPKSPQARDSKGDWTSTCRTKERGRPAERSARASATARPSPPSMITSCVRASTWPAKLCGQHKQSLALNIMLNGVEKLPGLVLQQYSALKSAVSLGMVCFPPKLLLRDSQPKGRAGPAHRGQASHTCGRNVLVQAFGIARDAPAAQNGTNPTTAL